MPVPQLCSAIVACGKLSHFPINLLTCPQFVCLLYHRIHTWVHTFGYWSANPHYVSSIDFSYTCIQLLCHFLSSTWNIISEINLNGCICSYFKMHVYLRLYHISMISVVLVSAWQEAGSSTLSTLWRPPCAAGAQFIRRRFCSSECPWCNSFRYSTCGFRRYGGF